MTVEDALKDWYAHKTAGSGANSAPFGYSILSTGDNAALPFKIGHDIVEAAVRKLGSAVHLASVYEFILLGGGHRKHLLEEAERERIKLHTEIRSLIRGDYADMAMQWDRIKALEANQAAMKEGMRKQKKSEPLIA